MTPAEFGQLTDQNAELSLQLEELEKEATKADEAAKRKLGKLEREIEKLKGDLDEALEQLRQKEEDERSSEAKRQRLEREERLLALKAKQQQQRPQSGVVDFSPPPILTNRFSRHAADDSCDEGVPFPSESRNAEVDLISQIVGRLRELEKADQEASQQQSKSHKKLKKAMIGAEGMKKVYDYLSDDEDLEVEIVDEDEFVDAVERHSGGSLDSVPEEDPPMRFSSLRRTINEDIHKRLAAELSEDEPHDHEYDEMGHAHPRPRGTIVGLFNSPEKRVRSVSLMDLQDEDSDDMDDSKIFSRAVSPIGSPLLMPQEPPSHIRSLGSELGSEYGNDLDGSAPENRHIRATSLSLAALAGDDTPSNRTTHSRRVSLIERSPTPGSRHLTVSAHQRSGSVNRSSDAATLDRTKSQFRARMLSQTISARSTRWSDGRLEDVAISTSKTPRTSGPLIVEMFNSAIQQVTGPSSVPVVTSPRASGVDLDDSREGSPPRPAAEKSAGAGTKESKKDYTGFVGFVLEIWLWLQFVLIILVFVWAMAKRGPRNVLGEVERKRG
jgi:hypothetical protein